MKRFALSLAAGVCIALGLFALMHALISTQAGFERDERRGRIVDFIRVRQPEVTQARERTPPRDPPPPAQPPPSLPRLEMARPDRPQPQPLGIDLPEMPLPGTAVSAVYLGGLGLGVPAADADVIPIVRIDPQWPREALLNRIEGWVLVEFTILEDGSVADARVIDSQPRRLFDRNALNAIYRWRFRPRIVDGVPVRRRATQRIEFTLDSAD